MWNQSLEELERLDARSGGSPLRALSEAGLLSGPPCLLVHAMYVSQVRARPAGLELFQLSWHIPAPLLNLLQLSVVLRGLICRVPRPMTAPVGCSLPYRKTSACSIQKSTPPPLTDHVYVCGDSDTQRHFPRPPRSSALMTLAMIARRHVLGLCPASAVQFGFPCDFVAWQKAGHRVALGTDAACSNDNMNVQQALITFRQRQPTPEICFSEITLSYRNGVYHPVVIRRGERRPAPILCSCNTVPESTQIVHVM